MDCDLLMYLRAARSMAAFVGWCDGGSTDEGCAAASMDETTIKSLHTLHQHNYDTGKALQAFVKIINPKSVDKRWSEEDAKKFVRGLKQHGKNFFKIRKELLPYKDTASLVEYYYLWKKTPAASTTRPHRRHRRPAFRRQAPTPTLPQGDDMDDVSSASEASEMESEEECSQPVGATANNHDVSSSCSRCSASKSVRWYEAGKDAVVCADCHHSDEMLMGQTDEVATPSCAAEDEMTRGAEEEVPSFLFRPVKEDNEKIPEDVAMSQSDVKSSVANVAPLVTKTEPESTNDDRAALPPPPPPVSAEENISNLCAKEEVNAGDEGEGLKKGIQSLLMNTSEEDQAVVLKKPLEQTIKTEEKTDVSMPEEANETKWFGFSGSYPSTTSFSPHQSVASAPSTAVASSIFDVKPPRAVASVAPTFQDVPQQLTPFQLPSSPAVPSSTHQQSSFRPPSPHDLCSVRRHGPSSTSSYSSLSHTHPTIHAPQTSSSHLLPSSSSYLPPSAPPYQTHLPSTSYQPIHMPSPSFSSSVMPEDMSTRRREPTPTSNQERPVSNSSNYKNLQPQQQQPQQQHQQQPICHNISDDEDDEEDDDCNITRSPTPDATPCNEQAHSTPNSIFIRKWSRGQNSCSRCDLEFVPAKNSEWAIRREEKMMQKSSSSSHHHHHHQPHHGKSSGHHQSVLKDGRRTEGRKEEDKNKSPMTNKTSDAQITSSLIGGSHHLPPFAGPADRIPSRPGLFHDPTPALSQLSAYARPHIGNQRCLNYSLPPPHSIEPYFRMPGMYAPGSRDVLDMDIDKHLWERDMRDRDLREIEFMEKMKQEIELKSAGYDRLPHLPNEPLWADMQRRIMSNQLAMSATVPPAPPGHLPGIFTPTGNLSAELMQRERFEQFARIGNQEQLAAAAARDGALMQICQRYSHDPSMLQRQINAFMANKAQESVHLVYHFAKADPLASAVSQASGMGGASAGGLPSGHIPPPPSALHSIQQNHSLLAFARDQERMYMELLSRPPYNTDPILAQQVLGNLTAQAAVQQEALQRQLAMERDFTGNPMLH